MGDLMVDARMEDDSIVFEVCVLIFFAAIVLYWIYSFFPYIKALGSADNIWERTKKHKSVTLSLPSGKQRKFDFHQQYREGGMGVGSCVWDGAIVLSQFLLGPGKDRLKGKKVLIVGAGLGLEAMAAALAGASQVVCSDGDGLLMDLTLENITANMTDEEASPIEVMELLWGEQASQSCTTTVCNSVHPFHKI